MYPFQSSSTQSTLPSSTRAVCPTISRYWNRKGVITGGLDLSKTLLERAQGLLVVAIHSMCGLTVDPRGPC